MESCIKIYDSDNFKKLLEGIRVVQISKPDDDYLQTSIPIQEVQELNISETMTCSYCKITFEDNIQQRQHYKTDWHRFNLKQNLKSLEIISEEKFMELADDVSSISGSDSEDTESVKVCAVNQGKIFFQNSEEKVFCLYKCLLYGKKDEPNAEDKLLSLVKNCSKNNFWTILMLGGGHFAGAVFNGSAIVVHKTFHCYTVRAKQGGSQGSKDNRSGTSHPKSAGASLRRYNEQALVQHVTDILSAWSEHIEKSHLIMYRAAGPYNRSVLFGGKTPVLKKNDGRIRNIPFSTRRPTFTELQRVFSVLTTIEIFSSLDSVKNQLDIKPAVQSPHHSRSKDSPKNKNINRAKSRELKVRSTPAQVDTSSISDEEYVIVSDNIEISFENLKQFEDTVSVEQKIKQVKKRKPKLKERAKIKNDLIKRELSTTCKEGDLDKLKLFVENTQVVSKETDITEMLNYEIDEHGNTALHLAAVNGHINIILWLMENGASPCNKNDKFQTPYIINADKNIRSAFRSFALENPVKYNYAKSQIPIIQSTMTEEELAEKKRIQKKLKREREKEKKKDNEIKKKEIQDQERFLKLDDREKRALAAERRMLAQKLVVVSRCFLCASDISGKVPFEYSGNRFCSMSCLKAHRLQNPIKLS